MDCYSLEINVNMEPFVYWNSKLTHNGVLAYKIYEGITRKVRGSSLNNLLNVGYYFHESLYSFVEQYKASNSDRERFDLTSQAAESLNSEIYKSFLTQTHQVRSLNLSQSRKVRNLCEKLTYYSQTRIFESKKSGQHKMKVAFLTLTAPEGVTNQQFNSAFSIFLDYLQRTANCVYVWKKELGDKNGHLHVHLLLNNFVPYYIVSWKWKRALIANGVVWPVNDRGLPSTSHYRIELPHSKKAVNHYISKYMSKVYDLSGDCGYLTGHSSILNSLKEVQIMTDDLPEEEMSYLFNKCKVIRHDYVTIICEDLLHIKKQCPKLGAIFEEQYIKFSSIITQPQKFHFVEQSFNSERPKK